MRQPVRAVSSCFRRRSRGIAVRPRTVGKSAGGGPVVTAENSHFSRFKPPLQNATSESFSGPLPYSGKNGFLLRKMRFPRSVWYGFACPILPYGGVFGTEDLEGRPASAAPADVCSGLGGPAAGPRGLSHPSSGASADGARRRPITAVAVRTKSTARSAV